MTTMTTLTLLRWFVFLGFGFLIGVWVWAVIVVTRIRREQAVAMTVLKLLSIKLSLDDEPPNGLKEHGNVEGR